MPISQLFASRERHIGQDDRGSVKWLWSDVMGGRDAVSGGKWVYLWIFEWGQKISLVQAFFSKQELLHIYVHPNYQIFRLGSRAVRAWCRGIHHQRLSGCSLRKTRCMSWCFFFEIRSDLAGAMPSSISIQNHDRCPVLVAEGILRVVADCTVAVDICQISGRGRVQIEIGSGYQDDRHNFFIKLCESTKRGWE